MSLASAETVFVTLGPSTTLPQWNGDCDNATCSTTGSCYLDPSTTNSLAISGTTTCEVVLEGTFQGSIGTWTFAQQIPSVVIRINSDRSLEGSTFSYAQDFTIAGDSNQRHLKGNINCKATNPSSKLTISSAKLEDAHFAVSPTSATAAIDVSIETCKIVKTSGSGGALISTSTSFAGNPLSTITFKQSSLNVSTTAAWYLFDATTAQVQATFEGVTTSTPYVAPALVSFGSSATAVTSLSFTKSSSLTLNVDRVVDTNAQNLDLLVSDSTISNLDSVPAPLVQNNLPYTLELANSRITAFLIKKASIVFEKDVDSTGPATLLNCLLVLDASNHIIVNGTANILLDENQYPPPPPRAAVAIAGNIKLISGSTLNFSPASTSTSPSAPYYLFNGTSTIEEQQDGSSNPPNGGNCTFLAYKIKISSSATLTSLCDTMIRGVTGDTVQTGQLRGDYTISSLSLSSDTTYDVKMNLSEFKLLTIIPYASNPQVLSMRGSDSSPFGLSLSGRPRNVRIDWPSQDFVPPEQVEFALFTTSNVFTDTIASFNLPTDTYSFDIVYTQNDSSSDASFKLAEVLGPIPPSAVLVPPGGFEPPVGPPGPDMTPNEPGSEPHPPSPTEPQAPFHPNLPNSPLSPTLSPPAPHSPEFIASPDSNPNSPPKSPHSNAAAMPKTHFAFFCVFFLLFLGLTM